MKFCEKDIQNKGIDFFLYHTFRKKTFRFFGMTNVLANFSNIVIPLLIFYVVAYGIVSGSHVYDDFIKGAKDGLVTVVKIVPTLIALMVGVGILRSSGFLTFLGGLIRHIPGGGLLAADLYSLIFIKVFSGSAATGLVLDIFKTYGPDSFTGMMASILCSCTETVFYTMSIYFLTAKVSKTRWTLTGALLSTLSGIIVSLLLTIYMVG